MPLATINPATGETVRTFPDLTPGEIDAKLEAARHAFLSHRRSSFADRADRLSRTADLFDSDRDRLARLMALEMGKPLAQGRAEAVKCATACRYYAAHAEAMLADEPIDACSFVRREPLGPVLALMPWNFPFWQVVRFAAPALMAGNVVLLKHADNVPQCGEALDDLFRRAGFAPGCFQYLAVPVPGVRGLIDDPRIAAVTLTGSVEAGRSVASAAGAKIKRTVLELGGSDPFVVLASADLDKAVPAAVQSRTQNCGQSCIAAKRFIVHESIYDRFAEACVEAFRKLCVGDPLAPETDLGPLAQAKGTRHAGTAGARRRRGGCAGSDRRSPARPARLFFSSPPSSPASRARRLSIARNSSDQSPSSSARATLRMRWPSPTTRPSASARASGPRTPASVIAPSPSCRPARSSSTRWSPRRPNFPSGASAFPATAASLAWPACGNLSTPRACDSRG